MIPAQEAILNKMNLLLEELRQAKPDDRSEIARRCAVTVTEFEKTIAYFKTYVVDPTTTK